MNKRKWQIAAGLAGVVVVIGLIVWLWPAPYCTSAKSKYGLEFDRCPDGDLRQRITITGSELRRGGVGTVSIEVDALYTMADADSFQERPVTGFSVALSLVDEAGSETPLEPVEEVEQVGEERRIQVELPKVRDGDYKLRAEVTSRIEEGTVDLPLALYAPARIHVLTDRPLYEPGNVVHMRALVLRARDLAPIDHRPGTWVVTAPTGEVMLEEKAPAGEWGVVAGRFPLDREAPSGDWRLAWRSAGDTDEVTFRVEPFTLPRFQVEASADEPFYGKGDAPTVSGQVTYSSGAPVANAQLEIQWSIQSDQPGGWPPPTAWMAGALPRKAGTDAAGRFEMKLPVVPADLRGQVTLRARLGAVDAAGDRVEGAAQVLLAEDAIAVQAITELAGGLVQSFNNRVYLRVTTADGRPLPGAEIQVKRNWSATDPGIDATLDADSVARVQIDPGPPVNVVVPPMPVRTAPRGQLVRRTAATDVLSGDTPTPDDMFATDAWLAPLAACGKWVEDDPQTARVALRVSEAGAIAASAASDTELDQCVLRVVRTRRLLRGDARLLSLGFAFRDPDLPSLDAELAGPLGAPDDLEELVDAAARDARDCLPGDFEGDVPGALAWQVRAGSRAITTTWMRPGPDDAGVRVPDSVRNCAQTRLARRTLGEPATEDQIGLIRYSVSLPGVIEESRPQPTIMKGYDLRVSATQNGQVVGDTLLRMQPGQVPSLRLRATPVLARPGDEVEVMLIRGPTFTGDLPEEIDVEHFAKREEVKVDRDARVARFKLPDDADGWFEFSTGGERALVFVRGGDDLAVSVTPGSETYKPGDSAELAIRTRIGGQGAQAAVGLFGVDQSLAQLTPLPGADDLRRVRPEIGMSEQAFGVLDGQALALGRIRGRHAAEATILRVSRIPSPPELDRVVYASTSTQFDPVAELTDRFYAVLAELHAQARVWEQTAPDGELMNPPTMAKLWNKALDAVAARGGRVDDAFGRRMRLHRLPGDLLSLTDPRQVVVVGTRLPEDVENWFQWVTEHKP